MNEFAPLYGHCTPLRMELNVQAGQWPRSMELFKNQKTILVVDDNETVLKFVGSLLTDNGYNVLTSGSGVGAIEVARGFPQEITLLLSDFQMPGMSGVELAVALTAERPRLKVLLMSGFPQGMLILNKGWHFLAKPFIASQLCALVHGLAYPEAVSDFST